MILIEHQPLTSFLLHQNPLVGAFNGSFSSRCIARTTIAKSSSTEEKSEQQTKDFIFSVDIPGMQPSDVNLDIILTDHTQVSILRLQAERQVASSKRSFNNQWLLNHAKLDVSRNPEAKLVDGVLTLTIPKRAYKTIEIPIVDGPIQLEEETENDVSFMSLDLPGMNASTIQHVQYEEESQTLLISGTSRRGDKTSNVSRKIHVNNNEHGATFLSEQRVRGYLVDGVLTFRGRVVETINQESSATKGIIHIPVSGGGVAGVSAVNGKDPVHDAQTASENQETARSDNWVDVETVDEDDDNVGE